MIFDQTAKTLSAAGGRALGKLYATYKKFDGLGYKTFTKLFECLVDSVTNYCSGIWGTKNYSFPDTIQNRAIRMYLGVHKFAANKAINGDFGWISQFTKRKICVFRYWNK